MKTRLAAALVAIGMPACQQDGDQAGAAPPETPGSAEVRSVDAREEDHPSEIWGDLAVVAPSDRYELKAYADDGTLVRIVRREHVPRITRAEDILVDPRLRPELRIPMEAEMLRVPQSKLEETFPAFAEIMSDAAVPLGPRIRTPEGSGSRAGVDRVRPGREGVGVRGDAGGAEDLRDRRGLPAGARRG